MAKLIPIKIPLLNPNEPESLLTSLEVADGQLVKKDEVVALIETTKSTGEVLADSEGYLVGVRFKEGAILNAGEILAYIGDSPDAQDPSLPPWAEEQNPSPEPDNTAAGLRITSPARDLAVEMGLDLNSLPQGPLVTQQMVQEILTAQTSVSIAEIPQDENRILIYGAGGHGRSLAELIQQLDAYQIIGFLDDGYQVGEEILGFKVLGGKEKLDDLFTEGIRLAVNGVGGISNLQTRLAVYTLLKKAVFHCPSMIHPTAFLENSAKLDHGNQVFPFAYLGTQVEVGYGCIINTGAIVSHNCTLAHYVNLSPGATLAGDVRVDEGALIGMRATVNLGVHIGKHARVGNGATVKADVPDSGIVPAGTIWPPRR